MTLDRASTAALARKLTALRPKKRLGWVPKPLPPTAIQLSYYRSIQPIADRARAAFDEVEAEILADLATQRKAAGHTDAAEPPDRKRWFPHALPGSAEWKRHSPVLDARRALHLAAVAQNTFEDAFDWNGLPGMAQTFGDRTNKHQRAQLDRQLRAAIGVPYGAIEKPVRDHVAEWTRDNVKLITSVPQRYFARIRSDVEEAYASGTSGETLAKTLAERHGQSLSDARRIARDQVSKLNGQLNQARQDSLGVTSYTWRTGNDNRVRDNHEALEGVVCEWAVEPDGGGTTAEEAGHPGSGIECFPPEMRASLRDATVSKLYRRWFRGVLTELVSESGEVVRSTINHPILTARGWRAAHLVDVGDYVFETAAQSSDFPIGHPEGRDPTLAQLFTAASELGITQRLRGGSDAWFHGDGTDEQIDVVDLDRGLRFKLDSECSEAFCDDLLALSHDAGLRLGHAYLGLLGLRHSPHGIVGGSGEASAILRSQCRVTSEHPRGSIAWFDAVAKKIGANGRARDAESFRERLHAYALDEQGPGFIARILFGVVRRSVDAPSRLDAPSAELLGEKIALAFPKTSEPGDLRDCSPILQKPSRIVEKRVGVLYAGHVLNLETSCGWYVTQNRIVRNCRCYAEPDLSVLLG